MTRRSCARTGATLVEFAVVGPVTFLLILGLVVGGLGVFRYQEVSHLAREATRYASTHGGQYQLDGQPSRTGVSSVASSADMQTYVNDRAVGLDASKLTVTISWSSPTTLTPRNMPIYANVDATLVPPMQQSLQNFVTVTVTYEWLPEVFLAGPINLSSTSTVAMSY